LQYINTSKEVTYKFKIFDKDIENKVTAITDVTAKTVKFVINELDNTEFTITLAEL
jgi:PBP1b-binding outer membrane lipoprotein LpoB